MIFKLYVIGSQVIIVIALIITVALYTQSKVNTQMDTGTETDNCDGNYFNRDDHNLKIARIQRLFNNDKTFDKSIISIAENYSFNQTETPHANFLNWETREDIFLALCDFAIQILKFHTAQKTSEREVLIVADLLKRIKMKVDDDASKYLDKWKTWRRGLSCLLRLLVMYEYIAHDQFGGYLICHNLIIKIVPKLDQLLNTKINDEEIILFGIPRLLTNFLFDLTAYDNDVGSNEFMLLKKYFNIEYNVSDEVRTGLYSDGSCITNNSAASYLHLLPLVKKRDHFYDDIHRALGFKVNYQKRVQVVLEKLLHPSIKYHVVGLFGNTTNKVHIADWWNVELLGTGVNIFPFTGIGIFKRPGILFAIRLHQSSITSPINNTFTLGLLQFRKIYHSKDNHELSEEQLVHELGVIRPATKNMETENNYECNAEQSYIGKLLDVDLLFWMNKYKVLLPYKCEVTEIGVMTDAGLVSRYRIKNHETDRSLIFVSTDTGGKKVENTINAGDTNTSIIKIILNDHETIPKIDWKSDKLIEFEYQRQKYELVLLDRENSYIVKHGSEVILGGTSSSNPTDFMVYNNQIFKRHSSFMYEPIIKLTSNE